MQFSVFGQNLGPGASIFETIRYLSTPQVGLPKKSLITKIPDFEGAAPAGALAGPTVNLIALLCTVIEIAEYIANHSMWRS